MKRNEKKVILTIIIVVAVIFFMAYAIVSTMRTPEPDQCVQHGVLNEKCVQQYGDYYMKHNAYPTADWSLQ